MLLDLGLCEVEFGNLVLLLSQLLLKSLFLLEHLLDVIILIEGESASLLNNLVQMGDFSFEVLDDFAGFFFFFLGLLNKLPGFVDFALEDSDSIGVLLSKSEGSLDSGCVVGNRVVELLASLDETFLRLV